MSDLDPRWQAALARHADAEPTPDAWDAITERAEDDAPIAAPTPPGRRWLTAAAVVAVLALGGIALAATRSDDDGVVTADSTTTTDTTEPTTTTDPALASGDPVISAQGEVVTDATGTHFCGGYGVATVATVGPPTCGQIRLIGWDWDMVFGEQTDGATTYTPQTTIVGVYDGETITVLDEVPEGLDPPEPTPDDDPDRFAPPCPTPPGGWDVVDPEKIAYEDLMAMREAAEGDPQFAGIWVDEMAAPPHGVYTIAFTDELDRHRTELAALWGGPMCVTDGETTLHALRAAADALGEELDAGIVVDGFRLDLTGMGPDQRTGTLEASFIYAPEGTEEVLNDLLGVPVRVTSFMQRIG